MSDKREEKVLNPLNADFTEATAHFLIGDRISREFERIEQRIVAIHSKTIEDTVRAVQNERKTLTTGFVHIVYGIAEAAHKHSIRPSNSNGKI